MAQGLDRSMNVRIPLDLLHRLENKLATSNEARAKAVAELLAQGRQPRKEYGPISMSDLVRRAIKLGMDIIERDPEAMRNNFVEYFMDEMHAAIALAATNTDAKKMLEACSRFANSKSKNVPTDAEKYAWDD